MRSRQLVAAAMVVFFGLVVWGQQTREAPSTAEERKKAITLTKKLEQSPLGQEATAERTWLTNWIIEIPDISVTVCDELLKPLLAGEAAQYRYSKELVAQQLAGSMVYLIEHPQEARKVKDQDDEDDFSINKAGLESALNAYESLVKSGAKGAKWGPLEEMVNKRKSGQLDDYVRTATLKCVISDTVTARLRLPVCRPQSR